MALSTKQQAFPTTIRTGKVTLRPFQEDGLLFLEHNKGRAYLGDEMGLGKTIQSLAWLAFNTQARPAVIICPSHLKTNWQHEVKKCLPHEKTIVLSGRRPYAIDHKSIIIINYDILPWWIDTLKNIPHVVIIDEAHYVKNRKAKRTKSTKELCKACKHVIMLSGTPIDNRPVDIYTPINILKPGFLGAFMPFAKHFCKARLTPFGWDFSGSNNLEELHKLLQPIMIRRTKEQVLNDLPDKERIQVSIDVENREEYDMMENDFLEWLKSQDNITKKKIAKAIAGGSLVELAGLRKELARIKVNPVIRWIEEFLNESEGKLVVFAYHHVMINSLRDHFSNSTCYVTGGMNEVKKQKSIDDFSKRNGQRLLIANIISAGTGLNLTSASDCLHTEIMFKPSLHLQAEDRIHRIGQKQKTKSWYIIAAKTLDEELVNKLSEKLNDSSLAIDGVQVRFFS